MDAILIVVFDTADTETCNCHDCTVCAQALFEEIETQIAIEREIREGRLFLSGGRFEG